MTANFLTDAVYCLACEVGWNEAGMNPCLRTKSGEHIWSEFLQQKDREPQPTDGPDFHADHAAWERRQPKPRPRKPLPPPHPDTIAQERHLELVVKVETYGSLDQLYQSAHAAIKAMALSTHRDVTGFFDNHSVTYGHRGNLVASEAGPVHRTT